MIGIGGGVRLNLLVPRLLYIHIAPFILEKRPKHRPLESRRSSFAGGVFLDTSDMMAYPFTCTSLSLMFRSDLKEGEDGGEGGWNYDGNSE